ncbi:hypothetical protein BDQ17DRAFT_728889 [Cyathus striatus]|nr:hypothetical protein BDQ17DRAFT_728889 [Cyathus striatus]
MAWEGVLKKSDRFGVASVLLLLSRSVLTVFSSPLPATQLLHNPNQRCRTLSTPHSSACTVTHCPPSVRSPPPEHTRIRPHRHTDTPTHLSEHCPSTVLSLSPHPIDVQNAHILCQYGLAPTFFS